MPWFKRLTSTLKWIQLALLNDRARIFLAFYDQKGELKHLEEFLRLQQKGLELALPNSPEQGAFFSNLGVGFRRRYQRTGDRTDLERAAKATRQAVDIIPYNLPDHIGALSGLGLQLISSYKVTGEKADLETAINVMQQAVELSEKSQSVSLLNLDNALNDHIDLFDTSSAIAKCLHNLGMGLNTRYELMGDISDLDKAITASKRAIELTPKSSPECPESLNSLANRFRQRYERIGDMADLEDAIVFTQKAVDSIPENSPRRPAYLNNLATLLYYRYKRMINSRDLEQALALSQQAVDLTPDTSPDWTKRFHNLEGILGQFYTLIGGIVDLERIIANEQQRIDILPDNSPDLPTYLIGLSESLYARYQETNNILYLEQAITFVQKAIDFIPNTSPHQPKPLNNLGKYLSTRYTLMGNIDDLEKGKEVYQRACETGREINPEQVLYGSQYWGDWALERQAWLEAATAYQYGIDAIECLYQAQLQRKWKEAWLIFTPNLHARAAYALARSGQLERAVAILEQGRAFLLSESLERERADLERLPELGYTNIYQQYYEILNRICILEKNLNDIPSLRQAKKDLNKVIIQIQQISGYEDFFRSLTFELDVVPAIKEAGQIVVYTAVTQVGSLALIIQANGYISQVWLDKLTWAKLLDKLSINNIDKTPKGYFAYSDDENWQETLDDITKWFWDVLMGEIIDHILHLSDGQENYDVILIPQGLLGLLPLHAAWTESLNTYPKRRYALDEINFIYIPNARSLKAIRSRIKLCEYNSLFAVNNPDNSLKFSDAEVAAVVSHFPEGQKKVLQLQNATYQNVVECLTRYPIAHFSTHGYADILNPLRSFLILSDQNITLQNILSLRLNRAQLAILSACQTNIIGVKLSDEVVSISTGLLQAGFAGVIATLWAVPEHTTMLLMEHFYELWKKGNLPPTIALNQSQIWLRDATREELGNKLTSVFHLLPTHVQNAIRKFKWEGNRNDQPFKNPYYWAAFTFTGVLK